MEKNCETCGKEMIRKGGVWSDKQWNARRFCSLKCHAPHHSRVMKGRPATNKGKKHTLEAREKMSISRLANSKRVWFGTKLEYRQIHKWVEKELGKPEACEHCRKDGLKGRKIHWANISHRYLRKKTDWIRLCTHCHGKFDRQVWLRVINRKGKKDQRQSKTDMRQ